MFAVLFCKKVKTNCNQKIIATHHIHYQRRMFKSRFSFFLCKSYHTVEYVLWLYRPVFFWYHSIPGDNT